MIIRSAPWRRIAALTWKETLQIGRDPSSLLIAFVLPVVLLFLFGYGLSLDTDHLAFGVVLEEDSADARDLADAFVRNRYFAAQVWRQRDEAANAMVDGRIRGMAVIPAGFASALRTPTAGAALQILTDGSEPNTAAFSENYAQAVFRGWLARRAGGVSDGPEIRSRVWFNAALQSRHVLLPGCITMILAIIGTLLTALVVAREWERGTMESLLATPVRPGELMVSKMVPYFVLGAGSAVFAVTVARLVFDLPMRGGVPALAVLVGAFLIASLALGLLVSTAAKNQFIAAQASLLLAFMPVTMLSGFLFELDGVPWPLRCVAALVPARYFVPALQTVFLSDGAWPAVLRGTGVLMLMATGLLVATFRKTGRGLESA